MLCMPKSDPTTAYAPNIETSKSTNDVIKPGMMIDMPGYGRNAHGDGCVHPLNHASLSMRDPACPGRHYFFSRPVDAITKEFALTCL